MKKAESIQITELAQYRKKQGLSQQQIADAIRISRTAVKHLEEGRFDQLGAAPYIRGHIINYCRQVGIDHQQILSQLPSELLRHQNVQRAKNLLPNNISKVKIKTGNFGRYLAGTGLLTVLLFSVYFIWDKANPFQPPRDNNNLTLGQSNQQTITYSSMLPPVSEESYQEPTQSDDTAIESRQPEAAMNEAVENSSPEDTKFDTETLPSPSKSEEITVKEQNDPIPEQQQLAATHTFNIEFELAEQAWVSIKTEQGEKVIQDLIGPGQRSYHSDNPMTFKIGNAEQVTLRINGETVKLGPFTKKNVANFHWPQTES